MKDRMKLSLLSFKPPNANILFLQVFKKTNLMYDQTEGSRAVFSLLYR
jgi:hypothetical protein